MIKTKKFFKKNKNHTRKKYKKSKKHKIYKKSRKIKLNKTKRKKKYTKKKYKQKGGNMLGSIWDNALNTAQSWSDLSRLTNLSGIVQQRIIAPQLEKETAKLVTEAEVSAVADATPVSATSTEAETVACGVGRVAATAAAVGATAFGALATGAGVATGIGVSEALSQGQNTLKNNYESNTGAIRASQATANSSANQQGDRSKNSPPPPAPPPPKKQPPYVPPGVPAVS